MSDVRSPISRNQPGVGAVRAEQSRAAGRVVIPRIDVPTGQSVPEVPDRLSPHESNTAIVSDYASPPSDVAAWLGNPLLGHALAEVSRELAPGGVAKDARSRYAASVIETHLAARRTLAKHLNALLRA